MVRAWYLSSGGEGGDPSLPHMPQPPAFLNPDELQDYTGVEHFSVDVESLDNNERLATKRKEQGFDNEEICEISPDKVKAYSTEQLQVDDEIRICVDGSGYLDVRDGDDRWIRMEMTKNDLLVLPAGLYCRFGLDSNNYVKVKRLFVGSPSQTLVSRPADDHPKRLEYVKMMILAHQ